MSINPPDGLPEDPDPIVPPEPVVPPGPVVPPEPVVAPEPVVPPAPPSAPPYPGPAQPYSGTPAPYPGPPPYPGPLPQPGTAGQPAQPPYDPYAYPHHPQQERGLGNGAKVGIGTGIGCLSYIVAFVLFLSVISALSFAGTAAYFVIFGLPVLIGIGLLFSPRSRGIGVGMLIVSAAAWLIVIGPCIGLISG